MKRNIGISLVVMAIIGYPFSIANAFNPQPEPPAKAKQNQAGHPAAFDVFSPNGQKQRAQIRGNQLILIGLRGGGTAPAPDGQYRGPKGSIVVKKGIIVQGGLVAPGKGGQKQGLLLPAVQKGK